MLENEAVYDFRTQFAGSEAAVNAVLRIVQGRWPEARKSDNQDFGDILIPGKKPWYVEVKHDKTAGFTKNVAIELADVSADKDKPATLTGIIKSTSYDARVVYVQLLGSAGDWVIYSPALLLAGLVKNPNFAASAITVPNKSWNTVNVLLTPSKINLLTEEGFLSSGTGTGEDFYEALTTLTRDPITLSGEQAGRAYQTILNGLGHKGSPSYFRNTFKIKTGKTLTFSGDE